MSDPHVICDTCCRARFCREHLRAEFPPDAARKWMFKTCPMNGQVCDVQYRAGFQVRGPVVGQDSDTAGGGT